MRAKLEGAKQNEPKCGTAPLPNLPERIYFDQNKLKQGSCQRHTYVCLYFGLIFTHKILTAQSSCKNELRMTNMTRNFLEESKQSYIKF